MEFFRNPEIRRDIIIYASISAVFIPIAFIMGTGAGILAVLTSLAFSLSHFIPTYSRYRKISKLSSLLDRMIHGDFEPGFEGYFEGELAILQNQLCKLATTLKEKTDSLLKDKTFLSDSLADISHQIRTPLTSLNIISSMLAREDLPTAKRLELAKKTDLLLDHMDRLVTTLLKIAMIDSGTARLKRQKVKVSRLIETASQFVDLQMELKRQKLIWTRDDGISFEGDPQWSAEALGNILKNCMQHTPVGGCIYVGTSENPVFTEISIRDEGPGIPEKDLPRLFERFYKGSASLSGGFGIGLSLARMVVTAQNGTIKVANSKEGGAVFTIRFYKSTL